MNIGRIENKLGRGREEKQSVWCEQGWQRRDRGVLPWATDGWPPKGGVGGRALLSWISLGKGEARSWGC